MQQVLHILSNFDNETLIISFIVIFIVFYAFISLFTWNLLKPLKYLGISTLVVGILSLTIRFTSSFIITSLVNEFGNFVEKIFPLILSPLQSIGIIFSILGLLMIIICALVSNKIGNKEVFVLEENIKEEF